MTKPYDRILAAERLALLEDIRKYISTLPSDETKMSADELDTAIETLEGYKLRVNAFAQLGQDGAFVLAVRIQKSIATLRRYRLRARLKKPQKRDIYLKGNTRVLRFLAEDELNDGDQWPRLLRGNNIKYSTDLLAKTTVTIP